MLCRSVLSFRLNCELLLVAHLKVNSKTTCCGSKLMIKTFSITLHGWIHGFHLLSYEFQDDRTLTPPPPFEALREYYNSASICEAGISRPDISSGYLPFEQIPRNF